MISYGRKYHLKTGISLASLERLIGKEGVKKIQEAYDKNLKIKNFEVRDILDIQKELKNINKKLDKLI